MPRSLKFPRWLHKRGISRRKLRGGFLHRIAGDVLFDKGLWIPTRHSVAWGWLVGSVTASNPFIGIQMVVAFPLLLLTRGNIPLTLIMIWSTNFATMPIFGAIWLVIGNFVLGRQQVDTDAVNWDEMTVPVKLFEPSTWGGIWGGFVDILGAITLGGFIFGVVLGVLGFFLVGFFWKDKPRPVQVPVTETSRD